MIVPFLLFKMPNVFAAQSGPLYNLGKVINDDSLKNSYPSQSLGVSVEFSAVTAC